MSEPFDREEVEELGRRMEADEELACPRCGRALDRTGVPPRNDVSYVRDRLWLVCGPCDATAVLDVPRRPGP